MAAAKIQYQEALQRAAWTPNGALVIQEDVYNLTVSSADAASFFVVGTVRRPCD